MTLTFQGHDVCKITFLDISQFLVGKTLIIIIIIIIVIVIVVIIIIIIIIIYFLYSAYKKFSMHFTYLK